MTKSTFSILLLSLMFILVCFSISASKEATTSSSVNQNTTKNTFAATVLDAKNQKTLIYNVTCGKGLEKYQEFHGLRGESTVIIPFDKVRSVELMGKTLSTSDLYASNPYVHAVFHLVDGHSIDVDIPANWVWRGDTAFGEMSIETQSLKVITFHQQGEAMKCPKCSTIFHLEKFEYCPYDGTKLEPFIEP